MGVYIFFVIYSINAFIAAFLVGKNFAKQKPGFRRWFFAFVEIGIFIAAFLVIYFFETGGGFIILVTYCQDRAAIGIYGSK